MASDVHFIMGAMDTLGVAASAATILQTALALAPPGRRRWSGRRERERAYLNFQRAALDVGTWAAYLPTMELVASNKLAELLYMPAVVREASAARAALAGFVGSLVDVRLVGNPGPRRAAEEITALVAELFATVPTGRPLPWQRAVVSEPNFQPAAAALRRVPLLARGVQSVRKREDGWQRSAQAFEDCQRALGIAHRDFTLAAQRDLGYGRRWWRLWRPARAWPGGWPGPDAKQLIQQARRDALNASWEL
jgi:hypothetical protein